MSLPPSYNLLKKFPNKVYLETGSFEGASIDLAYQAKCFDLIIAIESDPKLSDQCYQRFKYKADKQPYIFTGDSAVILKDKMLQHVHYRATILLDGHSMLLDGEPETENPFPLLKELSQIAEHPIKNHVILIDDIHFLTHKSITGWDLLDIKNAVWNINPNYKMELIANPMRNDFMICTV